MQDLKSRTGIAPINWSNEDMPELGASISLAQCLGDMQKAGFSGTEPGYKFPETPEAMNRVLNSYQLRLVSGWHSTWFSDRSRHQEQLSILQERLKFMKACGARCINLAECTRSIHGNRSRLLADKPVLSDAEWAAFLEGITRAGELCQKHGVALSYHHHMGTVVQNDDEIQRLMEGTPEDSVGLCLDTGHLIFAGLDSETIYQRYQKRIFHVHFKDVRAGILEKYGHRISFLDAVVSGVFTVPGDGMIDFLPLVSRLLKDGYGGWIIVEAEQDPQKADPLIYAQKAMTYLSALYQSN